MKDSSSSMTFHLETPDDKKNYQVVTLHGELDKAGLSVVKDELEKFADKFPYPYCVFDFSDLDFINSEGIGFFMSMHSHLIKMKKKLVIVSAKDHVKDVLMVIGILSVIELL